MSIRIKDLPLSERPRERCAANGPESLSVAELIAILLRTGTKGFSALDIAKLLVQKYQTLGTLAQTTLTELKKETGIGPDKAVTLIAAFTLAGRMSRELLPDQPLVDTPERVADLMRESCRGSNVEALQVLMLNTRRRLISVINRGITGTLDSLLVHPREVFREAISACAAAIILVHNHPSGDPSPSEADIKATRDLIRAGQIIKIEVLDHVIIGQRTPERPKDYVSLRESGYFYS